MAHLIDQTTGRPAIAYFGETPWHKLGRKMTDAERRNLPAAMQLAGVDYDVQAVVLQYLRECGPHANNGLGKVPDAQGIVRTDTGLYLGTVGAQYTLVQNRDGFGILTDLVEQGCTIEVMAALDGGRRAFALIRMPDATVSPLPGDDVRGYLLVTLSHDGSGAVRVILTPIRVVCQNTLTAAINGKHATVIAIRHTKSANDRVKQAREVVTRMQEALRETGDTYAALARQEMGPQQIAKFIEAVIPGTVDAETGKLSDTIRKRREEIAYLVFNGHHAGDEADQTRGYASAWRAYNAVTEYFDHVRAKEAKSAAGRANAYDSALFGGNAAIKAKALQVLVAAA